MKYMYETINILESMKWIIFIPVLTGLVKGLTNILIEIAREPPRITTEEIKDNTKELDIDEDLKKYFDYKE